jgi:hypothetical protein
MKKVFFALAAVVLLTGPVLAQEKVTAKKKDKKEAACHKGDKGDCCKEEQTAKGKSCCMPSKASAMKTASAVKKAKPAAKG